jgi:Ca2+/H+ antiporter
VAYKNKMDLAVGVAVGSSMVFPDEMVLIVANCVACSSFYCALGMDDWTTYVVVL